MKLKKLQLENFRNYEDYSFEFSPEKNLIVLIGLNGVGKTNFIEAIYTLSLGRSFRTLKRDDLVKWETSHMRCNCELISDEESTNLEVFYSKAPVIKKSFKKNGVKLKNSEYIGHLLTVLFNPEDLNMLYLSPSFRRKYMDILLSQTNRKYLAALTNYRKVLKQRNALLQEIRQRRFKRIDTKILEEDLDAWDGQIIEFGTVINLERIKFIEFLNEKLGEIYRSISNSNEEIKVKYVFKDLKSNLKKHRERDICEGRTSIGSHLDDLEFYINDKEITESASRGEFRTLLLAIKLAEIEFIKQKTGKNPILLLDDVFSELDKKRQYHLLKSVKECQTIITTTDINNLGELAKESGIIEFVNVE